MWTKTSESLPPKGEMLAVVHKLSSRGESVDEDAVWNGVQWMRHRDGQIVDKSYYYLWRRLET